MYFEVYKDNAGEFRWRLKAANHEPIASSGEGYKSKAWCMEIIEKIKQGAAAAQVKDLA